ncbi:sensor histidine kinase [Sungkyunkwania multivorans]|uniref:histidine kinase n=1 Tax=Sungkyunkwania multivorans TaxID=1173618 RepID=A0ABW3CWN3_9FLAO
MEQEAIQQLNQELTTLVIAVTAILFLMVAFVITFFSIFQKRKTKLLIEKAEEKIRFDHELAQSQNEIQEQTFQNISWELHDNIGQLLSVARMQLNMLNSEAPEELKVRIKETGEVVGKSLAELRALSKALNTDFIKNIGLTRALDTELQRYNKLNFLTATFEVHGEEIHIDRKDEIIIFRILQEFFSNVIKHSKASELKVTLNYNNQELYIRAEDNGVGFDIENVEKGSGLLNMQSRASLINADITIDAKINRGVCLILRYPLTNSDDDREQTNHQ